MAGAGQCMAGSQGPVPASPARDLDLLSTAMAHPDTVKPLGQ